MMKKSLLIAVVVLSGAVAAGSMAVLMALARGTAPEPSQETFQAARAALYKLEQSEPKSITDAAFESKAAEALEATYVVSVWTFDRDGRALKAFGLFRNEARSASRFTDVEPARSLIEAAGKGLFTQDEQAALVAAVQIRMGGMLDRSFSRMVRPVKDRQGQTVGLVGAIYDRAPGSGRTYTLQRVAAQAASWAFLVYKIALVAWVWLDARRRRLGPLVWAIYVLVFDVIALVGYLLARRSARIQGNRKDKPAAQPPDSAGTAAAPQPPPSQT